MYYIISAKGIVDSL